MFSSRHYVPVMRTKTAELRALRDMNPALRPWITPMLECTRSTLRGCDSSLAVDSRLNEIASHLEGWARRGVFLDFRMLTNVAPGAIELMVNRLVRMHVRPSITISLRTDDNSAYGRSIRSALDRYQAGLCLRVSVEELRLRSGHALIELALRRLGISPASVDLVIDRGSVNPGCLTYPEFAECVPWIDSWRTLTVVAGSFPPDLSELARGEIHHLPRCEWSDWRALDTWRGRRPSFGDYSVQHAIYKEPVEFANVSASVRYTLEDEYLVLRGESVTNKTGPGSGQWNAWAALLVEMPEFHGPTFSAGDRYIAERASNWKNTGNPRTWLQAAFSHHLTTSALQVAGRLEDVRRLTSREQTSNWASVIDINQHESLV